MTRTDFEDVLTIQQAQNENTASAKRSLLVDGTGSTIDSSNPISVTAVNTSVLNGQKNVTTAGTAVAITTTTTSKWVIIKALSGNTNNIYVGNSGVSSTNGYILTPGEAIGLDVSDLSVVFIDSDTNGEGVSYAGVN